MQKKDLQKKWMNQLSVCFETSKKSIEEYWNPLFSWITGKGVKTIEEKRRAQFIRENQIKWIKCDNPGEYMEKYFRLGEYMEKLWKMKKKFDVVVGNPPYGERKKGSSSTLHFKIMKTALDCCDGKLAFIMPSKSITEKLPKEQYNMLKNAVCNKIDIVSKDVFKGRKMEPTAIYYCDRNDNPENYCKKLDVDDSIYSIIDSDAHRLFMDKMESYETVKRLPFDGSKTVDEFYKRLKNGKYYFNVNIAGVKPGQGETQWLSGTLEKIGVLTKDEEYEYLKENDSVKTVIECPNKEYGENLKTLMFDGVVLRYGLWLTQTAQNIKQKQYRFVPNLDYTNIHSDEELLTSCGFNPEEIKTTMDYLRHFDFSQNRNDVVRNYASYEVETDEDE